MAATAWRGCLPMNTAAAKLCSCPLCLKAKESKLRCCEQKRGFARGHAETILQASSQRIEPHCPYFLGCGGCHYQHASYEHQLEIKAAILKENLRRIAKLELEASITIHPSPPWNYRNRTRLKVRTTPGFAMGYYKISSHELLPVEECPVSSPLINRAIASFWQLGRGSTVPDRIREIEFFVNAEDTQLLIEASCEPETPSTPVREWAATLSNALPEIVGIVVFKSRSPDAGVNAPAKQMAASGAREINYRTDAATYRVSAGAFFQINRHLINELAKIATEGFSGDTALDLYAGVGLFSTILCRRFAQVIAVESSQTAHADLVHNSPANVKAVRATTADFLRSPGGKLQPDLVVVDPPRSSLGETVVQSLVGLGAHRMTYISCDPATVSRDLAGLLSAGYRIEQVHLVDLFPQTYHLESVFHLTR